VNESTAHNDARKKAIAAIKKNATTPDIQILVDSVLKGDRTALARCITLVESTNDEHKKLADQIISRILPFSGNAIRIGITGVPGVGKSSLIETFGTYLTSLGKKVAVLAIDPSSPLSKGSILGDKTRMELLSTDPNAFIRPSASANSLGGVARKTRESMLLCEAAGFDVIIVETVGVGQSETAVHRMTDFFLLLMLAGAGDQLQGIKRGIMELCDALFLTKADGNNVQNVQRAKAEYMSALHFYPPKNSGWIPKVGSCSSLENAGMDTIWNVITEHREWLDSRGFLEQNRVDQDLEWMQETLQNRMLDSLYTHPEYTNALASIEEKIRNKEVTPFAAAEQLFGLIKA
jgi:LAO/AO transport system kinase